MARSLVLGNGSMLITLDEYGQLRDLYYPHVGLENHGGSGCVHHIGVFVDGAFSWLDGGEWKIVVGYEKEALVSAISARNDRLRLTLFFTDLVYNEKNIFLRGVRVSNESDRERTVKVFFSQQFQVLGLDYGNSAYFHPALNAIIHYRGRRVFLVSGSNGKKGFSEYSIGEFLTAGKEGTWRDAQDGALSGNPVEHGSVDSAVGFELSLKPNAQKNFYYWVTVGETVLEAVALNVMLKERTPAHITASTGGYWRAWLNKREFVFQGLDERVAELFRRSLLIIRTHADEGGAIIASGDSATLQHGKDTYGYMWPRDGAFSALALDKAGYFQVGERFFRFCADVLSPEGYLLHKYNADQSVGSSWHPWIQNGVMKLPIQEDETALVLYVLWEHYNLTRDIEFVEEIYNPFIKRSAEFLMLHRHKATGLPAPSYDLWEERYGISSFTTATVYGALMAAARFAKLFGKSGDWERFSNAAEEIQKAALKYLYDDARGQFLKALSVGDKGVLRPDTTLDASSCYGMFRFGVLSALDPRLIRAYTTTQEALVSKGAIGGFARYAGDRYYQVRWDTPGNPWFITTLWDVEYCIAKARTAEELADINKKFLWVVEHALPSGILSEQLHPDNGTQLYVAPLTWSHAAFVLTVIAYLEKLEELGICRTCYPVKG